MVVVPQPLVEVHKGRDAVEVALPAIYGQPGPGMAEGVRGEIKKVTEDCRGDIRPLSRHVKEWETGREKGDMWLQAM